MEQQKAPSKGQIEIFISCTNLVNKDTFSKSDPRVLVYQRSAATQPWKKVGETERIEDCLDPDFTKPVILNYSFEETSYVLFVVTDDDNILTKPINLFDKLEINESDLIGKSETTVGEILASKNGVLSLPLFERGGKKCKQGTIIVRYEQKMDSDKFVIMKWSAVLKQGLISNIFDKFDPFFRLSKRRADGTFQQIYEADRIKNNLNPIWEQFELELQRFCNADEKKLLRLECFDYDKRTNPDPIGFCTFTLEDLKQGTRQFIIKDKSGENTGTFNLINFDVISWPDFLDYMRGGLQFNLVVAADFTEQNKPGQDPKTSLHYINPDKTVQNPYQQALNTICGTLLDYDNDKLVPLLGFGGKPNMKNLALNSVSHSFPLNGDQSKPQVYGIDGIKDTYKAAVSQVQLSGPRQFSPVIQQILTKAVEFQQQGQQFYIVLLILTCGDIEQKDVQQTIDSLVYASQYPLSVIIVGLGNNPSLQQLKVFDGNDGLVTSTGQRAKRDLVQIIFHEEYKDRPKELAQVVLSEIPGQIRKYFRMYNALPLKPVNYLQIVEQIKIQSKQEDRIQQDKCKQTAFTKSVLDVCSEKRDVKQIFLFTPVSTSSQGTIKQGTSQVFAANTSTFSSQMSMTTTTTTTITSSSSSSTAQVSSSSQQQRVKELEEENKRMLEMIDELNKELQEQEQRLAQQDDEHKKSLSGQVSEASAKATILKMSSTVSVSQLKKQKEQLEKKTLELQEEVTRVSQSGQQQIFQLTQSVEEYSKKVKALEEENSQLKQRLESLQVKVRTQQAKIAQDSEQFAMLNETMERMQEQLEAETAQRRNVVEGHELLSSKVAQLTQQDMTNKKRIQELEGQLNEVIVKHKKKRQALEAERNQLRERLDSAEQQLQQRQSEHEKDILSLEEQNNNENARLTTLVGELRQQLETVKYDLSLAEVNLTVQQSKNKFQFDQIIQKDERIAELEELLGKVNTERVDLQGRVIQMEGDLQQWEDRFRLQQVTISEFEVKTQQMNSMVQAMQMKSERELHVNTEQIDMMKQTQKMTMSKSTAKNFSLILVQSELTQSKKDCAEWEAKAQQWRKTAETVEQENRKREAELLELQEKWKQTLASRETELLNKIQLMQVELQQLQKLNLEMQDNVKKQRMAVEKKEAEIGLRNSKISGLEKQLKQEKEANAQKQQEWEGIVKGLQKQIEELNRENQSLNERIEALLNDIKKNQGVSEVELEQLSTSMKQKIDELNGEILRLQEVNLQSEELVSKLTFEHKEDSTKLEKQVTIAAKLRTDILLLEKALQAARGEVNQTSREVACLQSTLQQTTVERDQLIQERDLLSKQVKEQESQSQQSAVKTELLHAELNQQINIQMSMSKRVQTKTVTSFIAQSQLNQAQKQVQEVRALMQTELKNAEIAYETLQKRVDELTKSLQQEQFNVKTVDLKREQLEQELECSRGMEQEQQRVIEKLRESKKKLKGSNEQSSKEIKHLRGEVEQLRSMVSKLEEQQKESNQQAQSYRISNEQLQQEVDDTKTRLSTEIDGHKSKIQSLQQEIDALLHRDVTQKEHIEQLINQSNLDHHELDHQRKEIEILKKSEDTLQSDFTTLKQVQEESRRNLEKKEAQLKRVMEEQAKTQQKWQQRFIVMDEKLKAMVKRQDETVQRQVRAEKSWESFQFNYTTFTQELKAVRENAESLKLQAQGGDTLLAVEREKVQQQIRANQTLQSKIDSLTKQVSALNEDKRATNAARDMLKKEVAQLKKDLEMQKQHIESLEKELAAKEQALQLKTAEKQVEPQKEKSTLTLVAGTQLTLIRKQKESLEVQVAELRNAAENASQELKSEIAELNQTVQRLELEAQTMQSARIVIERERDCLRQANVEWESKCQQRIVRIETLEKKLDEIARETANERRAWLDEQTALKAESQRIRDANAEKCRRLEIQLEEYRGQITQLELAVRNTKTELINREKQFEAEIHHIEETASQKLITEVKLVQDSAAEAQRRSRAEFEKNVERLSLEADQLRKKIRDLEALIKKLEGENKARADNYEQRLRTGEEELERRSLDLIELKKLAQERQDDIENLQNQVRQLKSVNIELEGQNKTLNQSLAERDKQITNLRQTIDDVMKELSTSGSQVQTAQSKLSVFQQQQKEMKMKSTAKAVKEVFVQSQLQSVQMQKSTLEQNLTKLQKESAAWQLEIINLRQQRQDAELKLRNESESGKEARTRIDSLETEKEQLQTVIKELKEEILRLTTTSNELRGRSETLEQTSDSLRSDLAKLKQQYQILNEKLEAKTQQVQQQRRKFEESIKELESQIRLLQQQKSELEQRLSALNSTHDAAKESAEQALSTLHVELERRNAEIAALQRQLQDRKQELEGQRNLHLTQMREIAQLKCVISDKDASIEAGLGREKVNQQRLEQLATEFSRVEKEKLELRLQSDTSIKNLRDAFDQIKLLEINIKNLQDTIAHLEKSKEEQIKALEKKEKGEESQSQAHVQQISMLQNTISQLNMQKKQLESEFESYRRASVATTENLNKNISKLENTIKQLQTSLSEQQRRCQELEQQLQSLGNAHEEHQQKSHITIVTLETSIVEIKQKEEHLQQRFCDLNKLYEDKSKEHEDLNSRYLRVLKQLETINQKGSDLQAQQCTDQKIYVTLIEKITKDIQMQSEQHLKKFEEQREEIAKSNAEGVQLRLQLDQLKQGIQKITIESEGLKQKNEALQKQLQTQTALNAELQHQLDEQKTQLKEEKLKVEVQIGIIKDVNEQLHKGKEFVQKINNELELSKHQAAELKIQLDVLQQEAKHLREINERLERGQSESKKQIQVDTQRFEEQSAQLRMIAEVNSSSQQSLGGINDRLQLLLQQKEELHRENLKLHQELSRQYQKCEVIQAKLNESVKAAAESVSQSQLRIAELERNVEESRTEFQTSTQEVFRLRGESDSSRTRGLALYYDLLRHLYTQQRQNLDRSLYDQHVLLTLESNKYSEQEKYIAQMVDQNIITREEEAQLRQFRETLVKSGKDIQAKLAGLQQDVCAYHNQQEKSGILYIDQQTASVLDEQSSLQQTQLLSVLKDYAQLSQYGSKSAALMEGAAWRSQMAAVAQGGSVQWEGHEHVLENMVQELRSKLQASEQQFKILNQLVDQSRKLVQSQKLQQLQSQKQLQSQSLKQYSSSKVVSSSSSTYTTITTSQQQTTSVTYKVVEKTD